MPDRDGPATLPEPLHGRLGKPHRRRDSGEPVKPSPSNPGPETQNGSPTAAATRRLWLPALAWCAVALLFGFYHRRILGLMVYLAENDANWSHAFLVPFVSLYYVWVRRAQIRATPAQICRWGLIPLLAGMLIYPLGGFLHSSMVMGYAMVLTLAGLVWFIGGPARLRVLAFPVLYLLFAVKITLLWDPFSLLLQRWAATGAALLLSGLGWPLGLEADATGAVIQLFRAGRLLEPQLSVEEACNGLRLFAGLVAFGVAWAFLWERPRWTRLCVLASIVPIALLVNVLRLTLNGFILPFKPELCTGEVHALTGLLLVLPALGCLFAVERFCERLSRARAAGGAPPEKDPPRPSAPSALPIATGSPWRALPPGMVTLLAILAAGSLSLNTAEFALGLAWHKQSLPLRRPLDAVAGDLGPYQLVRDYRLPPEGEAMLHTRRYIARLYRDTRLPQGNNGAAVWLHVVYYSGTEETMWIRHIPEVCYIAAGSRPVDVRQRELDCHAPAALSASGRVPVRQFLFQSTQDRQVRSTVYLFVANGRAMATKRALRFLALDPRQRYTYFCKIEVLAGRMVERRDGEPPSFEPGIADADDSLAVAGGLLEHALPEIVACLPEWPPRPAASPGQ